MRQALGRLRKDEQRAAMVWLDRSGSFWDDSDLRRHGPDDWLECRGGIVTDSAVGEAAFRTLHGVEHGVVSFTPSDWDFAPINVIWKRQVAGLKDKTANLENVRGVEMFEEILRKVAPPIRSWNELEAASRARFQGLSIASNCFDPLDGLPFEESAAKRFLVLLDTLDRFVRAFDTCGRRTPEGHQIYQDHFTGDRAAFSDSSDIEKRDFGKQLTFSHPDDHGTYLFCPWHGKVSRGTLRLHFSWPVRSGEQVYIVYAGPKITKR